MPEIDVEDCPLPEVREALGPYIKPRDEITAIRRGLQDRLQSQIRDVDTPLSSINLTSVPIRELDSSPAGLSGVRKAYWKALQAHTAAQAKYDALKTELDQLKHQNSESETVTSSSTADSVNETYVPLLRQRERHRRLKVLERALLDINSAGGNQSSSSVDDVVKSKLGHQPTPPTSQPSVTRSPEVEAKILELKKAVVSSRRNLDGSGSKVADQVTNGTNAVSPHAEIAGLQAALQELTAWMESQLTVIANAEAESQVEPSTPANNGSSRAEPPSTKEIESLYEDYLEARQRLLETASDSPRPSPDAEIIDLVGSGGGAKATDYAKGPQKSAAATLIPFIPTLVDLKEEEQALMQQSSHIRHQLSTAETDTQRLMHRMAEESHLVQPGASQGKDWAEAARNASTATESFVKDRLESGERASSSAKQALEGIRRLPGSLDPLLERS